MDLAIGVGAYALMTAGFTAEVGPGFGLEADVRFKAVSLALELRGVLPARVYANEAIDPAQASRDVPLDVSQWTALLVPCVHLSFFVACGVGQLGALTARGHLTTAVFMDLNLGPRLGLELTFADRVTVFGFGEALIATSEPAVNYDMPDLHGATSPNSRWVRPLATASFGAGLSIRVR